MSVHVSFHRLAELELNDAAHYYNSESAGLGDKFLTAVEDAAGRLAEFPGSGQVVLGRVRRHLVHGFPYALLYSIETERVRILAVMNLKRRPFYWADRT